MDIANNKTFRVIELEDQNQMLEIRCHHLQKTIDELLDNGFESIGKMIKIVEGTTSETDTELISKLLGKEMKVKSAEEFVGTQNKAIQKESQSHSGFMEEDPDLLALEALGRKFTADEQSRAAHEKADQEAIERFIMGETDTIESQVIPAKDREGLLRDVMKEIERFNNLQEKSLRFRKRDSAKNAHYWKKTCEQKISLLENVQVELCNMKYPVPDKKANIKSNDKYRRNKVKIKKGPLFLKEEVDEICSSDPTMPAFKESLMSGTSNKPSDGKKAPIFGKFL